MTLIAGAMFLSMLFAMAAMKNTSPTTLA